MLFYGLVRLYKIVFIKKRLVLAGEQVTFSLQLLFMTYNLEHICYLSYGGQILY